MKTSRPRAHVGPFLVLSLLTLLSLPAARAPAVDFLRGDTNGDGLVTAADAVFLISILFFGDPARHSCEASGDFEDDESITITDCIRILEFASGAGPAPASPYPVPGPDTTSIGGYKLPCNSYGGGAVEVSDPAARLRIADAVAPGGDDVHATITVEVSSSLDLWSYGGKVRVAGSVLEDTSYLQDRIGLEVLNEPFRSAPGASEHKSSARVRDGELAFGFISTFVEGVWMPAGDAVPALAVTVCLEEGTPAGEYALTLEEGELTKAWTAGAGAEAGAIIRPALASGTLTVLEEVAPGANCGVRPYEWALNARFELAGATAPPGTVATLPFTLHADRACEGFVAELEFDPEVLEAVAIRPLYGVPQGGESLEISNDEGKLRTWVRFSNGPATALPARRDHEVFELDFLVKPETTVTSTEVRFGEQNSFRAFEDTYTVETADSFVLVNGLINVLPDGTLFIRGDSNGDSQVDISDAQTTLGYLFLRGAGRPSCYDAADANDDGLIDVSDAVATLNFLFLGAGDLPAPSGEGGSDPTADRLGCSYRGS